MQEDSEDTPTRPRNEKPEEPDPAAALVGRAEEHMEARPEPPPNLFIPERIVLGENEDGSLAVLVTDAGRAADAALGLPTDCELCRLLFRTGDAFYRVFIGADDEPDHVGAPAGRRPIVEDVTELVVCESCEKKTRPLVDAFLEALWALRAPDLEDVVLSTDEDVQAYFAGGETDDTPPTERA